VSHASVPTLIIERLKANPTLAAKIGDRIHYQAIPQESQLPHIYFTLQDESEESLIDGSDGVTESRYLFELVAESFDDELVSALKESIQFDGFDWNDLTIFLSDISNVSDDYLFRSARSDADFMHASVLTIYLCEQ
jgi:hypothetical protein